MTVPEMAEALTKTVFQLEKELTGARTAARRLMLIVLAQEDIGESFARVLKEYPWLKEEV